MASHLEIQAYLSTNNRVRRSMPLTDAPPHSRCTSICDMDLPAQRASSPDVGYLSCLFTAAMLQRPKAGEPLSAGGPSDRPQRGPFKRAAGAVALGL